MGLILNKKIAENTILGLWKIEESYEELLELINKETYNSQEINKINSFKNLQRKKEWLCSRILFHEISQIEIPISYNEFGKPFLKDNPLSISISHSKNVVGVLISSEKKAGLDIEKMSGKIAKIALKFLNNKELEKLDPNCKILHLYLHWNGKETLYKIHGKKNIDFKKNLHISPFKICSLQNSFEGKICINTKEEAFNLNYFLMNEDLTQKTDNFLSEIKNNFLIVWSIK